MPFISNNNNNPLLLMTSSQPQHHLLPHNCKSSSGSSRWNPTPEQITMLEEVYKSGTRTPTTEQIQEIAIKLSKYGKIEGKNVFYWFQNHKARERQKRRRRDDGDDHHHTLNLRRQHLNLSSSGGHRRLDHTKICPSFPQQQQMELAPASYNKDNNEDHGTTKESERRSDDGKDATWMNLINPINTEDCDLIITSLGEKREIRTLDLFPVKENQEKTGGLGLIEEAKQACCNYCYYYEFIPLKK